MASRNRPRPPARRPSPEVVLRLTGPGEVVAAVPHLLGFTPTQSLVAIGLSGDRCALAMTLRIDLPGASEARSVCAEVAGRMAHSGASSVVVVVYPPAIGSRTSGREGPAADGGALAAGTTLLDDLACSLAEYEVDLVELLVVANGRWWSATCGDPDCCPPGGTPVVDGTGTANLTALNAAGVLSGRSQLPDRATLVASIAAPVGAARRDAGRAQRAAQRRMKAELTRAGDEARLAALERFAGAVTAFRASPGLALEGVLGSSVLGEGDLPRESGADQGAAAAVADLVVWLRDVPVRDAVVAWVLDDAETLLPFLIELARRAVPPHDAPVCGALAWVALCQGDGALANVALDRGLCAEPTYSMALLLLEGMQRQLPPQQLRSALADARSLNRLGPRLLSAG